MCLIALAYRANDAFPLVIAGNRDEFLERQTAPLALWRSAKGTSILGGRDLQEGGSWMGFTPTGRFAVLTNVRDPAAPAIHAPISRGSLVSAWLDSRLQPQTWANDIEPGRYNGFNLIVGDWVSGDVLYLTNKSSEQASFASELVRPGSHSANVTANRLWPEKIYGLSNASLDTPWPKTVKLKSAVTNAMHHKARDAVVDQLLTALADREAAPDDQLPSTGVPIELERALSSAFVSHPREGPRYGTRTSWVAILACDGQLHVAEQTHQHQSQTTSMQSAQISWPIAMVS